jgi:hypothetical protein
MRTWSKEIIAGEILRRYHTGQDLSYSALSRENLPLLRAATGRFGNWRTAIEFVGLDYEQIRKYKIWTRERILARIGELHRRGEDLSWSHVSRRLDPALAAAAIRKCRFGSWKAALEQAGLDYEQIRRYLDWSEEAVLEQVRARHAGGEPLNARGMEQENIRLLTAARRRFPSWDRALSAAGLDQRDIVLRAPFGPRKPSAILIDGKEP